MHKTQDMSQIIYDDADKFIFALLNNMMSYFLLFLGYCPVIKCNYLQYHDYAINSNQSKKKS